MKQGQESIIQNELSETPKNHTVWVNETERIASFHPVEGSIEKIFSSRDYYISFLLSLHGYRFQ